LWLNDGRGTFGEASSQMPAISDVTYGAALGDVDRDGDLDCVFANHLQDRLYLNDGAGRFTDVTAGRLPVESAQTFANALGDVDGDGDLDLVLGNYGGASQDRLFLNDGTGTFTDATSTHLPA